MLNKTVYLLQYFCSKLQEKLSQIPQFWTNFKKFFTKSVVQVVLKSLNLIFSSMTQTSKPPLKSVFQTLCNYISKSVHKNPSKRYKCNVIMCRISTRVVKALTEDYVCVQTRNTFGFWMKLNIEDGCIYVPKKTALSKDCGGLMLYQNLQSILDVQDFCNKEFGKLLLITRIQFQLLLKIQFIVPLRYYLSVKTWIYMGLLTRHSGIKSASVSGWFNIA